MAAPRVPTQDQEWLPTGFPPRSFAPGPAAPPPPPPPAPAGGGGAPSRGWRWAVGAAVLAVLLLGAALFLATRGDDDGDRVAAGTSTSALDTSVPTFEATTSAPAPLPSIDPVTTPSTGPATSAPGSTAAPGVLETSATTLTLPRTDANAGASQGTLTLTNRGGTPLTYTAQTNSAGLSVAPARGTIGPGASVPVTVTLDGSRIQDEGPFTGALSFGGTGGTKAVQVVSVVGRAPEINDGVGESCAGTLAPCSRHIKLATSSPTSSPCNTPWLYSVLITDQSRIQSARVIARRGLANSDAALRRGGNTDIFQSDPFRPLSPGTVLRFSIEAIDEHGFGRRLGEQTITC